MKYNKVPSLSKDYVLEKNVDLPNEVFCILAGQRAAKLPGGHFFRFGIKSASSQEKQLQFFGPQTLMFGSFVAP